MNERVRQQRLAALRQNLTGRASADPSSLSRAYGLPAKTIAELMREMGVQTS